MEARRVSGSAASVEIGGSSGNLQGCNVPLQHARIGNAPQGVPHRAFAGKESENRDPVIHCRTFCPARSGPGYPDVVLLQNRADGTDRAGLLHREAEIMLAFCVPFGRLECAAGDAWEGSSAARDFYDVG